MSQGEVLATGVIDSYQVLGAFGQPVHRSYVQLRATIEQRLGARHANFFARPQIDERTRAIRWVAPLPGPARRWTDLAPAEQAQAAQVLASLRAGFQQCLDDLTQGSHQGGAAFAAVLTQALQTPNDGCLYVVGDQPVATFWGFKDNQRPAFDVLAADPSPAIAAAIPQATPAPPARRPPWWLWLAVLLALGGLAWWVWSQVATQPLPAAQAPAPEPAPTPAPEPVPAVQAPAPAQLALPDAAVLDRPGAKPDMGFLAGRWRSISGLTDESTGLPIELLYDFDDQGQGVTIIRRSDGVDCRAPVQAEVKGGKLHLQDLRPIRCRDGKSFKSATTVCARDSQGQTLCRATQSGGNVVDVQIERIP